MHWNLSFYRLSCNLHLTNSYSSLYSTRILILTHAQPIRSSPTKKELSYNVPIKTSHTHKLAPQELAMKSISFLPFNRPSFSLIITTVSGSVCERILLSLRQNTLQKFALNSSLWRVPGVSLPSR